MKDGVAVTVPDPHSGGQENERARVIDWAHPEQNDFLLVSQLTLQGPLYPCRPDLVGFVKSCNHPTFLKVSGISL